MIEDRGIDEIYIDLTQVPGAQDPVGHDPLGGVRALAREIKNNVQRATGLSCSIGVTPNKLLSKIASELDKPDGLTVLTMDDLPTRIWPLPVRRVNGIGPGPALANVRQTPEHFAEQCASMPLNRGTSPEEICRALRFILSAPSMTGQMIALDGGQHLSWAPPAKGWVVPE